MKKLLCAAVAAAASLAATAPAQAATTFQFDGVTGTFSNTQVESPDFTDVFASFVVPIGSIISLAVTSSASSDTGDLDFTSVTLNGVEFDTKATGDFEFRTIRALSTGDNIIRLTGVAGSNATYAGTINVAAATPAVPEPASWAMMIAGFGLVGTAMRRRASVQTSYAV